MHWIHQYVLAFAIFESTDFGVNAFCQFGLLYTMPPNRTLHYWTCHTRATDAFSSGDAAGVGHLYPVTRAHVDLEPVSESYHRSSFNKQRNGHVKFKNI